MAPLDYLVLVGYFAALIAIGVYSAGRVRVQEDYFMGGRSFGKLLQTFAAFGSGTGSSDPVNTGRTTLTSGMSGMWSVMCWLFVTPFYWIAGVWYRRMRCLTLGDWFVERYESRALGAAYAVFGILFFMVYSSMLFSAIGKVAAPLIQAETFTLAGQEYGIEYLLVPIIGIVVLIYGAAGGLEAAYFTDLLQGLCIILLSVLLIPFGLRALVEKFGDPETQGLLHGFRIMHEQAPKEMFAIVGSSAASEFPLHRILAVVLINLVGVVVQPHFIATGGGSARTELSARVGMVTGNFLKRFCTIGWVLTALIALVLFADDPELIADPDKTWGVASRELLGPGLTGLMLACLLAALMSSLDAYMIVGSALVVRNLYAAYVNAEATERRYVLLGRLTGSIVVAGAVLISLFMMNMFEQLQLTWVFPVLFAAPFWAGMYWRRATTAAAWSAVAYAACVFFLIPFLAPRLAPALRTDPRFTTVNRMVKTIVVSRASSTDLSRENARRRRDQAAWDEQAARIGRLTDAAQRRRRRAALGPRPRLLRAGDPLERESVRGGESIFWGGGVRPVDAEGRVIEGVTPVPAGPPRQVDERTREVALAYPPGVRLKGFGNFKLDFLLYRRLGVNLADKTTATLAALELPPKIIAPFLVMILVSLLTPPNRRETLDRYYAKMKTPVDPDPRADRRRLEAAWANPARLERRKLLPGSSFEFQKMTAADAIGLAACLAACFAIVGAAVWISGLGA